MQGAIDQDGAGDVGVVAILSALDDPPEAHLISKFMKSIEKPFDSPVATVMDRLETIDPLCGGKDGFPRSQAIPLPW